MYIQELDPIVWLSSSDWCTFVQRRVREFYNFQERLSRFVDTPKYGSVTWILTHVIQHVGIAPIIKNNLFKDILSNLRFEAISERFGCFFLHDLDLANGALIQIPEEDTPALLRSMGIVPGPKPKAKLPGPTLLPSEDGITWKQLEIFVNLRNPKAMVRDFVWDPIWSTYAVARPLFCQFTFEYWNAFKEPAFQPLTTAPATLEQAMELWSLKSVEGRVNYRNSSIHLKPSADGLEHNIPPKSRAQLFSLKRRAFFPEPDEVPLTSSWWTVWYGYGYIKDYHNAIKKNP